MTGLTLLKSLGTIAATLSLLALPFRGVTECTMGADPVASAAATAHAAMGHAASDASAGHEHGPGAPRTHDVCPDLAGCAAVGTPTAAVTLIITPALSEHGDSDAPSRIAAPPAALDPPPPRA